MVTANVVIVNMENEKMIEFYKIKAVVVGANAVGKTSLIRRYVTHKFSTEYQATIGMDITVKEVDTIDEAYLLMTGKSL